MARPRHQPEAFLNEFKEVEKVVTVILRSLKRIENDFSNISKEKYDHVTSQLIWLYIRKCPSYLNDLKKLEKRMSEFPDELIDAEKTELAYEYRISELVPPNVIKLPKDVYFFRKTPVVLEQGKLRRKGQLSVVSRKLSGEFIEVVIPNDISVEELNHFFRSKGFKLTKESRTKTVLENMVFGILSNSSAGLPSEMNKSKVLNDWRLRIFGKMTDVHDEKKADSTLRNQIADSSKKFLSLAKQATSKLY